MFGHEIIGSSISWVWWKKGKIPPTYIVTAVHLARTTKRKKSFETFVHLTHCQITLLKRAFSPPHSSWPIIVRLQHADVLPRQMSIQCRHATAPCLQVTTRSVKLKVKRLPTLMSLLCLETAERWRPLWFQCSEVVSAHEQRSHVGAGPLAPNLATAKHILVASKASDYDQ